MVWINLNDTDPAAPVGRKNVKWQAQPAGFDPRAVSAYDDNGGVNAQTGTSYTIVEGDNRKLVYFNNAAAVAVAIDPSADLGATFFCWLENLGAGTVTLTPNGTETVDGAASLTLDQNQGLMLFSDGSNLFTSRGKSGGSGTFTAGGDLSGTSSSQTVVGLRGKALDSATVGSPSDGDVITYDSASGKYKAATMPGGGGYVGTPPSYPHSSGTAGQYSFDPGGSQAYFCYATNLWMRLVPGSSLWENLAVSSGLVLLYDPSVETAYSNGSSVSTIHDLYGSKNATAVSTGATYNTNQINTLPDMSWPGTSAGKYTIPTLNIQTAFTIFAVIKNTDNTAKSTFLCGPNSSIAFWANSAMPNTIGLDKTQVVAIGNSSASLTSGAWSQVNAAYTASTGAYAFRIARAAAGSGTNVQTISQSETVFGYNTNNSEYNRLPIAFFAVYNRVLTSTEITSVEAWIFNKFAV